MQNEITSPIELLNDDGTITEEGWARRPLWHYNRSKINAHWSRIKEWDYYAVLCHKSGRGITLTLADLGYAYLAALCWLDLSTGLCVQLDSTALLPKGKSGFSPSSERGDLHFSDGNLRIHYKIYKEKRILDFEAPRFNLPDGSSGIKGSLELTQPPELESIVIATSWKEKRDAFYYNQKINCMPASGTVTAGDETYTFEPHHAFGSLDWGRGRWTYINRWYWGSASGLLNGVPFGWNIGYGFSDRTPASENCLFYDNRLHKLEEVTFHMDTKNYMKPWKFTSSDGRFELDFKPVIDRKGKFNLLLIKSDQHQVFGYFTGTVKLDDGTALEVKDFPGFAEDVYNRW